MPYVLGIPEIDLPPIDPLHLETVNLTEGSGNFRLLIIVRDLSIFGLNGAKIENFR